MKQRLTITASVLLLGLVSALASCGGESVHFTGDSKGRLYLKGEQTITLLSPSKDFPEVKFEKDIAISDISLGSDLAGKTVTNVSYISEDEVQVSVSGTGTVTNESDSDYTYAMVNVADHGLTGSSTGEYLVTYCTYAPRMSVGSTFRVVKGDYVDASSEYYLPYGNFAESYCTSEYIKTTNGVGTVSDVSLENNVLTVKIENGKADEGKIYPCITIDAKCTSFNHAVTIEIGYTSALADLVA